MDVHRFSVDDLQSLKHEAAELARGIVIDRLVANATGLNVANELAFCGATNWVTAEPDTKELSRRLAALLLALSAIVLADIDCRQVELAESAESPPSSEEIGRKLITAMRDHGWDFSTGDA